MRNARLFLDYLYIVIGSAITAFSVVAFLNPAQLAPGGVSGIATLLYYAAGWDLSTTILAINLPIFLIGTRFFGRQYGVKTLLGSVLLAVFTWLWTRMLGESGVLDASREMTKWLSSLFGGVTSGIGIGIVMKSGSNTGGTDIIAQIMARYTPLTLGTSLFAVDGVIIAASALLFGLESALYAIVVVYIMTAVIDKIVLSMGTAYAKTVFIISDRADEIGRYVTERMDRGATLIDAKGFYTKESRPMLMTVIPNQNIAELSRAVRSIDRRAFMIVNETFHVVGEGYTPIEKLSETSDVTQR